MDKCETETAKYRKMEARRKGQKVKVANLLAEDGAGGLAVQVRAGATADLATVPLAETANTASAAQVDLAGHRRCTIRKIRFGRNLVSGRSGRRGKFLHLFISVEAESMSFARTVS